MERKTQSHKKVRRPRRWKWIVAIVLGLLLGLALTLFLSRVYNPFGSSVDSPMVLIPGDAHFLLSVPDFPEFLGELRSRDFVAALDGHQGFQRFLRTSAARETGIVDALRDAFRQLDELSGSLPFGLELLGDVSGKHVLVAGYLPVAEDDSLKFMVVFRPESWKTIAGVNVLLDEQLYGWFVADRMEGEGISVDHMRDQARIRLPTGGQDLWITRIADTVVVSTEERQLAQIRNTVGKYGLPAQAAPRFLPLEAGAAVSQVQLLANRKLADRFLKLESQLLELWGPENLDLAESALMRLGGDDVIVDLDLGRGFGAGIAGDVGEAQSGDINALLRPYGKEALQDVVDSLGAFLPGDVFGLIHLQAPAGDLVNALVSRPDILTNVERGELDEWLAETPMFGSRAGFVATLNDLFDSQISLVFFRQERDPVPDNAEAGYALICPVRDQASLDDLLEKVERHVLESGGAGLLKQLVKLEHDQIRILKPILASGIVDDPRVTVPGLALVERYFILSNWLPFLERIPKARAQQISRMIDHEGLRTAVAYAPRELLMGGLLDSKALFPYLEQSSSGWAYSRTTPTQMMYAKWREEAHKKARLQGLRPDSNDYIAFINNDIRRHEQAEAEVERPRIMGEIRLHLDYFRGLLRSFGFFVESTSHGARFALRLDPEPVR